MIEEESLPTPQDRTHKLKVRLAVLGLTASELGRLASQSAEIRKNPELKGEIFSRQNIGYFMASKNQLSAKGYKKLSVLFGVEPEFFVRMNWDGVFSPIPSWLQKELEKAKTTS